MQAVRAARPPLREIPLASVWPPAPGRGLCFATMNVNQWDGLLAGAYRAGFVLLELNDAEQPVRAYQNLEDSDS